MQEDREGERERRLAVGLQDKAKHGYEVGISGCNES